MLHESFVALVETDKEVEFLTEVIKATVVEIENANYAAFDALTTSSCCHGISHFTRHSLKKINDEMLLNSKKFISEISLNKTLSIESKKKVILELLPTSILSMCAFFILQYIVELDLDRGRKSIPKKLKKLGKVGTNFCEKLVRTLQIAVSNLIANWYSETASRIPPSVKGCGIKANIWAKYVQKAYLRKNRRNVTYASSMFSIQTCLLDFSYREAYVCVSNTVFLNGKESKRIKHILRGDGSGGFSITPYDILKNFNPRTPIPIFSAVAFIQNNYELPEIEHFLQNNVENFSFLVHCGEVYYPQFPKVSWDTNFDSSSITPEEDDFALLEKNARQLSGLSLNNPSRFYLNHIYTESAQKVVQELESDITDVFLPTHKFIPFKLIEKHFSSLNI